MHFNKYKSWVYMSVVFCFFTTSLVFFTNPKIAEAECKNVTINTTDNNMTVPITSLKSPEYVDSQKAAAREYYKNCVSDGNSQVLSQLLRKDLQQKNVTWIQSGLQAKNGVPGSPTFITNTGQFNRKIDDSVSGKTLTGIAPIMNSAYSNDIIFALQDAKRSNSANYLVSDVPASDYNNFVNGSGSSWNTFFAITQKPQNNPYGSTMLARREVDSQVQSVQSKYQQQMDQSGGFVNYEVCEQNPNTTNNKVYNQDNQPVMGINVTSNNCQTLTPGVSIQHAIDIMMGSDYRGLEVASNYDQLSQALTGQLSKQILGGTSGLLRADVNSTTGYPDNSAAVKKYVKNELNGSVSINQAFSDSSTNNEASAANIANTNNNSNTNGSNGNNTGGNGTGSNGGNGSNGSNGNNGTGGSNGSGDNTTISTVNNPSDISNNNANFQKTINDALNKSKNQTTGTNNSIDFQKYLNSLTGILGNGQNKSNVQNPPTPSLVCVPSTNNISLSTSTSKSVTWVAAAAGGTPPFTYFWIFADNGNISTSTGQSTIVSYANSTIGSKAAIVSTSGTDGNIYSSPCSSTVNVTQ